jgi:hypothetical protein
MERKELVISHHMFLTQKQRYSLSEDDTTLEVSGSSLGVWKKGTKTNEPAEAVECKYKITNNISRPILQVDGENYKIALPDYESRAGLLNPKDGGFKGFQFAYKEVNENYDSTHYIIINDYDEMIASKI